MIVRKRSIACVVANDDERPLQVHLDDMHPNSRMRKSLEYDASSFDLPFGGQVREAFFVNVSRDCIRSMVASQRHNHLICKGETSVVELKNELSRDCVDVGDIPVSLGDDEVMCRCRTMCSNVVDAMFEWPRLQESRSNSMDGRYCTWTCTPSHFVLQFAQKPTWNSNMRTALLKHRVTRDIVTLLCLEDFVCDLQTPKRTSMSQRDREMCCVATLIPVVQRGNAAHASASDGGGKSPFWYFRHDQNSPRGKLLWTHSGVPTASQVAVEQTLLLLSYMWKDLPSTADAENGGYASSQQDSSDADDLKGMRIYAKLRETVERAALDQWSSRLISRVITFLQTHPNLSDLFAPTFDGEVTLEQKMLSDAFEMRGYTITRWLQGHGTSGIRPIVFPSMFCMGDATKGPVCIVKRIA